MPLKKHSAISSPTTPYQFRQGIRVMDDSVLSQGYYQPIPAAYPIQLARGPGRVAGALNVFQAGLAFAPIAIPTRSFGGTQAGTIQFSPLVDTTGDTSGE